MCEEKKQVIFILGATGTGKSDIAIKLAKRFNGEIISADSVQIFKEFNIGSAKITEREMNGIKHYGLDIISPNEEFSVYDYVEYTKEKIEEITQKGKIPIIVGGTGLYIKSLIEGYNFGGTEKHDDFREQLEKDIKEYGLEKVYNRLLKLDYNLAKSIDKHNPVRVIRALEIATFGSQKTKQSDCEYDFKQLVITLERPLLYQKINKRVDLMIKQGLVEEVKNLYMKYGDNVQPMKAIGYKEVLPYLKGDISFDEMVELIKQHTRNYAKRQMTFLRKLNETIIIDNSDKNLALEKASMEIKKWIKK